MSKVCNPPKVLNPRTGKCVGANYLKQLNKKQAVSILPPHLTHPVNEEIPETPPVNEAVDMMEPKEKKQIAKKPVKVKTPNAKANAKALTDYKKSIIDNLKILEDFDKLNKEPFKARAYGKVIDSLELFDGQ